MAFNTSINDPDNQRNYIRHIYSNFWSKFRKIYGNIKQYDEDLIRELSDHIVDGGKVLEVGIGDGYPYANRLSKQGYQVYGIDLSPTHVAMVEKELPDIIVDVGDAQKLKFPNDFFDGVFCFRSTWYFPDLESSLIEMIRVLRKKGILIFDIQNLNHPVHRKNVKKQLIWSNYPYLLELFLRFSKNLIKLFLRPIKYYQCDWSTKRYVIISSPTDPDDVHSFFNMRKDVKYKVYGVEFHNPSTLKGLDQTQVDQFDRLVYKVWKTSSEDNISQ